MKFQLHILSSNIRFFRNNRIIDSNKVHEKNYCNDFKQNYGKVNTTHSTFTTRKKNVDELKKKITPRDDVNCQEGPTATPTPPGVVVPASRKD